jgi:hypothetical protein
VHVFVAAPKKQASKLLKCSIALKLLFLLSMCLVVTLLQASSARAQSNCPAERLTQPENPCNGSCQVIKDKEVTASEIQRILKEKSGIKLENVHVKGRLILPERFDLVVAKNVVFDAGMDGGRPEVASEKTKASGRLELEEVSFLGSVDFYLGEYLDLKMEHSTFEKDATFHSLVVPCFWLSGSSFEGQATFTNLTVHYLQLTDVKFKEGADFSGAVIADELSALRMRTGKPILIRWEQFGETWYREGLDWAIETDKERKEFLANYEEARKQLPFLPEKPDPPLSDEDERSRLKQVEAELGFWKRNFEQLGFQIDARRANYRINEVRRDHFSSYPAKATNWVLEKPNGFGTNPYRPLFYSIVIILAFALLYFRRDPFIEKAAPPETPSRPKHPLIIFALLYSIDTFIPVVTVTGVKNWGWTIAADYRWTELTERLIGLALTSLAAFSLSIYFL